MVARRRFKTRSEAFVAALAAGKLLQQNDRHTAVVHAFLNIKALLLHNAVFAARAVWWWWNLGNQ